MEKITRRVIEAVVAIITGLGFMFFKQFLAGIILTSIGITLVGIDTELRNFFLNFIVSLYNSVTDKGTQFKNSPSIKQRAGRDAKLTQINNYGHMEFNSKKKHKRLK